MTAFSFPINLLRAETDGFLVFLVYEQESRFESNLEQFSPFPESGPEVCGDRINNPEVTYKREHHFFTFMGSTIFSIGESPVVRREKGRKELLSSHFWMVIGPEGRH